MPAADKERVVTVLRQRLPLDEEQAAELADRAEEIFLAETGRSSVPGRAFWLWVDLAMITHREAAGEVSAPVTSVKRGDTTIQYGSAAKEVQNSANSVMSRVRSWRVVRAR